MKVIIASEGQSLDSSVSQVLARCQYFVILETETGDHCIIPNPYRTLKEHAGLEAAEWIARQDIRKVIGGEFGNRFREVTDKHGIQLVVIPDGSKTVQEIMQLMAGNQKSRRDDKNYRSNEG